MLGDRHFKDGDLAGALAHYSNAVGVWDGEVAEAHRSANKSVMAACLSNRSLVQHKKADHEAALADAERALDVDATFAKAHLRAAAALDALGRGDDAAAAARGGASSPRRSAKAERPRVAALGGAADRDDDAFADLTDGRDPWTWRSASSRNRTARPDPEPAAAPPDPSAAEAPGLVARVAGRVGGWLRRGSEERTED
ncbi:sulfotransferase [Aureococcus anophagefferens]|nr:sulfotransferase [Aureococcus anophagefferens]